MKLSRQLLKLRRWLRYNPPVALSSTGWRSFNREFEEKAPYRYWLNDTLPRYFRPIRWKIDAIREWLRYRTTHRYHRICTGLPPGYQEISNIMLHSNFTLLKNFVEMELARRYSWDDPVYKKATKYTQYIPFYRVFKTFCNPELGINHLKWEMTLDDPSLPPHEQSPAQAKAARETFALYDWWVNVRPARPEITYGEYSDQGLGSLSMLDDEFDRTATDYVAYIEHNKKMDNLQQEWDDEDDKMLIRLVSHRNHLWS